MAVAMPLATWSALLNNFVIERAGVTGVDIGWLHTVREIPGFLAVGVIAIIILMREQVLGLSSLALLGVATAVTAWFPSFGGILFITLLSSIAFHYHETVNQSLQLQWLPKECAPQILGWMVAVGSGASLLSYGLLVISWDYFDLSYDTVYLLSGGACAAIAIYCMVAFPQFEAPEPQVKKMILRKRYWLYYALQFMSGARFGFQVHEVTALFLCNFLANMFIAPVLGQAVAYFGEKRALAFEYVGLVFVFVAYACVYYFDWRKAVARTLIVVHHVFFSLAFALKRYFQTVVDPGDIAPTAAVAFTINHIAAVFLPVLLGDLWIVSPAGVFVLAAGMAMTSLALAMLIPRHPVPGHETVFYSAGRMPLRSRSGGFGPLYGRGHNERRGNYVFYEPKEIRDGSH
jgi:hypothetical protein